LRAFFWTSSEYYPGVRPSMVLYDASSLFDFANNDEATALSVRCIKN